MSDDVDMCAFLLLLGGRGEGEEEETEEEELQSLVAVCLLELASYRSLEHPLGRSLERSFLARSMRHSLERSLECLRECLLYGPCREMALPKMGNQRRKTHETGAGPCAAASFF